MGNDTLHSADIWLVGGALAPISLKYAEKMGPIKVRLLWESDTMARVVIPPAALLHSLGSTTTPFAITVAPAGTEATKSTLANAVDHTYAVVGVEETLTLTARDAFVNVQAGTADVVAVQLVEANPVVSGAPVTVAGVVTTPGPAGTFVIKYTLTAAKPRYDLTITLQAGGTGPVTAISGSPFQVECQVSTTDPA